MTEMKTDYGRVVIDTQDELFATAVALTSAQAEVSKSRNFLWALTGGSTRSAFYHWCVRTQAIPPQLVDHYWQLRDDHGNQLGEFDYVIISAPAPQTAQLFGDAPGLLQEARSITMNGCWAAIPTGA